MGTITLNELVSRIDEIPIFPQTVSKILKLVDDPKTNIRDIENEILKDQGFTTKVLKLANSAYFGVSRQIKTVSQATTLLGFQAIRSMVLASSVGSVLSKELIGYALEREALWKQSQICAITARVISKKIKFPQPDQAYTAGLLKDIGKVILDHYLNDQFQNIMDQINEGNKPFLEVEEEILGFNHCQVGARIAEKWKLPEDLVEAIAYHHQPEKAQLNLKLVAITHVADGLVMMMGLHIGSDGLAYNFSNSAMELLNLDETILSEIISEVADFISDENMYIG
ncbi:MAG: hydrolase [Firmicutes bacterium HGW-Firmicutes-1]|nr:MAG: hydrolase [Firmicutes bacterium HGW-Firmicutes-1]